MIEDRVRALERLGFWAHVSIAVADGGPRRYPVLVDQIGLLSQLYGKVVLSERRRLSAPLHDDTRGLIEAGLPTEPRMMSSATE